MGRTFIRQPTQIRKSDTYDDTLAAGVALETAAVSVEDDFNGIRSQLKRIGGFANWYDNLTGRDLGLLDTDLSDLEGKRLLCGVQQLTNVSVPAWAKAAQTLSASANFADGETVTIDGKVYTFQLTLTDVDGHVAVGVDLATSLSNLAAAVNLGAGSGTAYAASTTLHSTVTGSATATSFVATAKVAGTAANSIAVSETAANASWGNTTLSGGAGDVVVLSVAGGEAPTDTAAIGTGIGAVVAVLSGDVGTADLAEVAGANALTPKNIVQVRDANTHDSITYAGQQVFGLLQAESGVVQGDAFDDLSKQVQITFVINNGADDLEIVSGEAIGGKSIEYEYPRRITLDTLPEDCAWPPTFVDQATSVAVTLDNAIDNQSGPATQTQNIVWEIADGYSLDFQATVGGENLLHLAPDAAGDVARFTVDLLDVNTPNPADFSSGIKLGTSGQEIDLGVTAGTIESTGVQDLRILGANELFLDDGNQVGSTWAQADGIKLSETTAEWDAFETAFGGEVSLLSAIVNAKNSSARGKTVAVVNGGILAPGTNVTGVGPSSNLDAQLGDYSTVTSFKDDVDVFLNGVLLRGDNDTTGANNNDVYPGDTPANGDLKFEFRVKNDDVITMIVWG